jgi:large subunit ribosomal protein L4
MRRLAIRSVLSDKVATDSLIVLNDLSLETPRTKDMIALLNNFPASEGKRVLMMLPRRDENAVLSTRNIPSAKVQHVASINVVELLKHDVVIMPVQTVRWIEMVFGEGLSAEEASLKIADTTSNASSEGETPTTSEANESSEGETPTTTSEA